MNGVTTAGAQILSLICLLVMSCLLGTMLTHNTFTITDNLTYYLDNHKMGGLSFEHQLANNSYMRNGTGYYRYASVDDFINQAAPRDFALTYGYDGELNPTAEVAFNQFEFIFRMIGMLTNFKLSYGTVPII
jgi:hypothetical protein